MRFPSTNIWDDVRAIGVDDEEVQEPFRQGRYAHVARSGARSAEQHTAPRQRTTERATAPKKRTARSRLSKL